MILIPSAALQSEVQCDLKFWKIECTHIGPPGGTVEASRMLRWDRTAAQLNK
jgi:hypothetical protein